MIANSFKTTSKTGWRGNTIDTSAALTAVVVKSSSRAAAAEVVVGGANGENIFWLHR